MKNRSTWMDTFHRTFGAMNAGFGDRVQVLGPRVEGLGAWFGGSGLKGYRNEQRFPGGLVFKAHRLRVSLKFRLGSNEDES